MSKRSASREATKNAIFNRLGGIAPRFDAAAAITKREMVTRIFARKVPVARCIDSPHVFLEVSKRALTTVGLVRLAFRFVEEAVLTNRCQNNILFAVAYFAKLFLLKSYLTRMSRHLPEASRVEGVGRLDSDAVEAGEITREFIQPVRCGGRPYLGAHCAEARNAGNRL